MKKIIIIITCLLPVNLFSQQQVYKYSDIQIIKADTLYPGLYYTFDEFIKNSPSITNIYFKNNQGFDWCTALFSKYWEDLYYYDSTDTKIKLRDKIWGYSNGKKTFVYHEKRFCPIELMGRYNILTYRLDKAEGPGVNVYTIEKEYILDILTGEIYPMTKKIFKKYLLKDFPEILERFRNESMVHTMFYMYIKEINSKFK